MRKLSLIIAFILLTTSIHAADAKGIADAPSDIAEFAIGLYKKYGRIPTAKEYNDAITLGNAVARYYDIPEEMFPYHFPYRPIPVPPSGYSEYAKETVWQGFLNQMETIGSKLANFMEKVGELNIVDGIVDEHGEEVLKRITWVSMEEAKEYMDALSKALNIQIDTKAYIDSRIKENAEKEKSDHNF